MVVETPIPGLTGTLCDATELLLLNSDDRVETAGAEEPLEYVVVGWTLRTCWLEVLDDCGIRAELLRLWLLGAI